MIYKMYCSFNELPMKAMSKMRKTPLCTGIRACRLPRNPTRKSAAKQKPQKLKSLFANFAIFGGCSFGASSIRQACRADLSRQSRFSDGGSRFGEGGSNPVKVNQTDLVGQAGTSNPCKCFIINSLQNKQLLSGQTMLNLVKHGQNKPIRFDFRIFTRSLK